ncbi:hypothetical protein LPJ64_003706 [Coemansia asiatica]|uniref:Uncharacterized protein n=1 Tax=Coemansia asiatica TaxID=1052880 RepID=A0A9W7XL72_9FUNG|nr:hypothetical protein LPJ64_003706 [Coemansia asiatica]
MVYPFTTSIPLMIGPLRVTETSSNSASLIESGMETARSNANVSGSSSAPSSKSWLIDSSVSSTSISTASQSAENQVIELSTHIVSPLTLESDDIVELVVSHVRTTSVSPSTSSIFGSSTSSTSMTPSSVESNWGSTPAAHELFELAAEPTKTIDDYSEQILPKRFFRNLRKREAYAYKQGDESEDATRSARSLLSAMREIATRSENASPKRQSQISAIRSALEKQMIYPDEVVLDDDDYRDQFQPAQDLYSTSIPTYHYVDNLFGFYYDNHDNLSRFVYNHGHNNRVWCAYYDCRHNYDNNNNNNSDIHYSDKSYYCDCYRNNH